MLAKKKIDIPFESLLIWINTYLHQVHLFGLTILTKKKKKIKLFWNADFQERSTFPTADIVQCNVFIPSSMNHETRCLADNQVSTRRTLVVVQRNVHTTCNLFGGEICGQYK